MTDELAAILAALDRVRCANPDLARAAIARYQAALDLHDIKGGR